MNKRTLLAALASACICAGAGVQGQPPADCKPSSLNIPGAPYPCVHPDRRVTFRVSAPDAQKVQVRLGGAHDMTQGCRTASGWLRSRRRSLASTTTASSMDGAVVADPATPDLFRLGLGQQRDRDPRSATAATTRREGRSARRSCASAGITPRSLASGGAPTSTRRRTTTPTRGAATRSLPAARLGRERAGLAHAGSRRSRSWTT